MEVFNTVAREQGEGNDQRQMLQDVLLVSEWGWG